MNKPEVSIILPAYNCEKYLDESIGSVLAQSYRNWELIVIDDGSTDGTAGIVDAYAACDRRITAVHTVNSGVAQARNKGLEVACGEFITFIDSDDLLEKQALESLLEASDNFDMVIGNYTTYPKSGKNTEVIEKKYFELSEMMEDGPELLMEACLWTVWGKLFRREKITGEFIQDQRYGEDTEFLLRQLKNCRSVNKLGTIVYKYRTGMQDSLSKQKKNIRLEHIEKICREAEAVFGGSVKDYMCVYFLRHMIVYLLYVVLSNEFEEEIERKIINDAVTNSYFVEMPLKRYRIFPQEMRVFTALKCADYDLIRREIMSEEL